MKVSRKPAIRSTVSGLVLILATGPGFALDADAFAERLKTVMDQQGLQITYADVETSGSDVTLKGLGISIPGEDDAFPAGTVTLENVEETGDGGYRIGVMNLDDLAFSDKDFGFVAEGMAVEGLRVPPEGGSGAFGDLLLYEAMRVGKIRLSIEGREAFDMSNLFATIDVPENAGDKMLFDAGVERVFVDFTTVDDPQVQQTMKALGYETLEGRYASKGYWIASSGQTVLEENRFTVDNAASLNIVVDISGYTPALAMELQKMSRQMQESGGNEQAQGLAMLGLLQQLTFNSAAIRVDDASLTGRLLDFFAAQQGTDRNGLVNQAKGVLPFMLAQLGNPEFAAQITAAVGSYLDNPQSLEVRAEPGTPVPFAQLMATGMSAPQTLPDALGVKVTANQ